MRKFWFSLIIFLLMALFYTISLATTYYVKNAGNDSNSGLTEALAWQHMVKVCTTLIAGDTVLIMGGTYDEQNPGTCNPNGECGTLYPENSGTSGNWIVYKAHPDYARPIMKGNNYTRHAVEIGGSRSYIVLDGLEVTESWRGIIIWSSSYITVKNCKVHHTVGPCNENNGGVMLGYDPCNNITVQSCSLYHNYEVCDGDTADGWNNSGIHVYRTKNSVFEDNVIWDQPEGFGIRLKWLDTTNVVRRNIVHDCEVGISVCEGSLNNDVYENIIYDCENAGIMLLSGVEFGSPNNTRIWNNVVYGCDSSGIKLYPGGTISNFQSWNNIVVDCSYGKLKNWTTQGNNHPDLYEEYNCYYDSANTEVIYWCDSIDVYYDCVDLHLYTVAEYQVATIYGDHDIQLNPLFVDPANHDFHLQANSPCKGTGKEGEDMGAYPFPPVIPRAHRAMIRK